MNKTLSRRGFLGLLGVTTAAGALGWATGWLRGPSDGANASPEPKTMVGIYPSWSRYERGYLPGDVPLDRITHLQYAYLTITEDGSVDYADRYGDTRNLTAFRERKRAHPDTKMLLSVGGFFASEYYSNAALDGTRRARFARTAVAFLREYDFDGLDLDWQYPSGGNPNAFTREGDVSRFTLLLSEVRRQLDAAGGEDDKEYELSISASINPQFTENLDVGEFADLVDRVNVMAYDYAGPWDELTGFTAPLYNPFPDSVPDNPFYVANAMTTWKRQPIDSSKLSLGFAAYGRAFSGVSAQNQGFDQPFEGTPPGTYPGEGEGAYDYWDIEANFTPEEGYESHWHGDAAAPFRYSAVDGVFLTYDDERSVAEKARYVADEGFGGMTMWDFNGDRDRVLLDSATSALAE
ncbi:glycoside hydrolase family 18 protein [Halomicroarcula limicola]|uniref:Glycoside hydrolase family 18 protein n=1 Tax=Haloarcula limicola TaxID=1429915 RepID=A0A8J8C682_9EURY|nr:glycoside hydrolase family 18 protein [Halomicroarcula limicola]MBV0923683.1 glycoside hydrolase family 18 protein [Halomicroarcula limicola]